MGATLHRLLAVAATAAAAALLAPAIALATTETASSGTVSAVFSYQGNPNTGFSGLNLQISRAGRLLYDQPVSSLYCRNGCWPGGVNTKSVKVVDLDSDGEPEVLLELFSGGAHCCTIDQVFSFDG